MINPCKALNPAWPGLSIKESPTELELIISRDFDQPLALPEVAKIRINIKAHARVHIYASSSEVSLILEPESQVNWYALSVAKLDLQASVAHNALLAITHINLAHKQAQATIKVDLKAPQAELNFKALDQLSATQTSNINLSITHKEPYTKSTQAFRGIYAGESMGYFRGSVTVAPHAHHSAAAQLYKSILLSKHARAHVKPELEIHNFDITASHGASIGQLEQEALFYLRSRGLSLQAAQKLLVQSLAQDITQEIPELMRDYMSHEVELSLGALHA
jgi:Fe-S cluster assembly protein SufD